MIEIDKLCEELKDKYDLPLKAKHEQVAFYQKVQTALIICIVAAVLINGLIMLFNHGNFNLFGVIFMMMGLIAGVVIVIVIFSFLTSKKVEEYNRKYTNSVGKEMLSKYYEDPVFYYDDHFDYEKLYEQAGYNDNYNESDSRKQFSMKYKGRNIKAMDICLQHETTDSDGDTHTTTVFNGLFLEVDLGYNIGTNMSIAKNYDTGIGKSKLEMDSKEFEDCFNVYTDDKVKSMQLLTADVMERLKELFAFDPKGFDIAFSKGKLYLRFDDADYLFSYGTEEVIEKKYITQDMNTLYLITVIIDNIDYAVEANHIL